MYFRLQKPTKTGHNENSKAMAALIDTAAIRNELESSKYVAIRVQTETEAYTQFCQICKLNCFY